MSCTSPVCYLVPKGGGRPKPMMCDHPVGDTPLGRVVYLPCGGCLACRRERRQDLTILQACEASLYSDNWFLTLTYDDWSTINITGLPPYTLVRSHLSCFVESMRKYCTYNNKTFRFFACGEYGETYKRPHYHLNIFGLTPDMLGLEDDSNLCDLRSKRLLHRGIFERLPASTIDSNGNFYWESPVVNDRWPFGSHKLYRANKFTYQYVAGYIVKKLTGKDAREFRRQGLLPEFQLQSRPSIGRPWFDKFIHSISNIDRDKLVNDAVNIADCSWRCPRIFDKWLQSYDHFDGKVVSDRLKAYRTSDANLMPDRFDLMRKAEFDRYSAKRYDDNKRSHKEIK